MVLFPGDSHNYNYVSVIIFVCTDLHKEEKIQCLFTFAYICHNTYVIIA